MTQALEEKITQLCATIAAKDSRLDELDNKIENFSVQMNCQNARMSTVLENLEKAQTENHDITLLMEELLYSMATSKFIPGTTENTSKKQVEKLVKLN